MVTYSRKYIPGDRLMTCAMCGFDYRYSQMRKVKWPILDEKGTSAISRNSGNLLTNGGFELGATTGWGAGSSATLSADTDNERTGSYCLKITENGAYGPYAYQAKTLTAGLTYAYQAYVKAGTEATYYCKLYDNTTGSHLGVLTGEASTSWMKTGPTNITIPAGSASFSLGLGSLAAKDSGHTMFFDDVELYEIYEQNATTLRDAPEGMYVCPKCYDGNHPRNIERKLRKKETLKYPS